MLFSKTKFRTGSPSTISSRRNGEFGLPRTISPKRNGAGFTLIELLVVIAIVSLLSSIVLSDLNDAREKAKIAAAKAQVRAFVDAVFLLEDDTRKWPNGCSYGEVVTLGDNQNPIDDICNALYQAPTAGLECGTGCTWTAEDVTNWRGPYMSGSAPNDPWGEPYFFDGDYWIYRDCPEKFAEMGLTEPTVKNAIVSWGPNGKDTDYDEPPLYAYDCDDIFIILE